jgi:acetyltransferase-like isoleucine patch superfamily enzyme
MTHSKDWYANWKMPVLRNGMNERGYWIDYVDNLRLGFGADISIFVYMNAREGIEIGRNVEIGQHTSLLSWSSIGDKKGRIVIGDDVMIGSHCTIMPNVRIGNNVVIGAYSYIDKNVPDGARIIPRRKHE